MIIQGVNNHHINAIQVLMACKVINTQKVEVAAIMHQYAYNGKEKQSISVNS